MDLREFMSVRCAANVVRQETPLPERLTFEELAILCHLAESTGELRTSDIADYQGVLRPTMTHRTNHLADLGLIVRHEGAHDRRSVCCAISDHGLEVKMRLCSEICQHIHAGAPLHRSSPQRMAKFIDGMGRVFCMSGDLVLLSLLLDEDHRQNISELVHALGLLQPTVSMSINALERDGLIERSYVDCSHGRILNVSLLEKGAQQASHLAAQVEGIVIKRTRRPSVA
jgi:DNA-binding MarR family transcriptional regulator